MTNDMAPNFHQNSLLPDTARTHPAHFSSDRLQGIVISQGIDTFGSRVSQWH